MNTKQILDPYRTLDNSFIFGFNFKSQGKKMKLFTISNYYTVSL